MRAWALLGHGASYAGSGRVCVCGHGLAEPGQLGRLGWLGWFGSSFSFLFSPLFYFYFPFLILFLHF
jgi:hypothetical protein